MKRECVLDFETASQCDLKDCGAWRYSEDITTEILCLCFSYNGHKHAWTPGNVGMEYNLLWVFASDPDVIFIRHGDFEVAHWRNIMVPLYGFPDVPNERWHDTLAVAACKSLPLALEKTAQVLRLPLEKDMEGRRHTLGLSKFDKTGMLDRSGDAIQRVVEYCMRDVEAEEELHKRLGYLPADERQAFDLHQIMNQRGLRLDLPFINAAQSIVDQASVPMLARYHEITGFRPSQGAKSMDWLWARGALLPNLTAETVAAALGEEVDEDTEVDPGAYNVRLSDECREALEIRQRVGSSSIKKLRRMASSICEDGRARGLSQYHGTSPGRSTGRLWQPYNLPRPLIKAEPQALVDAIMTGDPEYVSLLYGPPIDAVISSLRHAIIPAKGHVFLSGDYAGIQARVVLALSGQHDKTALMAAGEDVYCDMAEQIYKRPITKKDMVERQVGKNSVLGLGFGMGWKKFKFKYGKNLSDEFCEEVVRVYREEWAPKVPKLWKNKRREDPDGLRDAAVSVLEGRSKAEAFGIEYRKEDGWLTARLPSGRKIWYWNAQLQQLPLPWDETKFEWTMTFAAMKTGRMQEVRAHGGLLCLGAETEVLTTRGFVRIVNVKLRDLVWDGECWVNHSGLVYQGQKDTICFGGVEMTPDHRVYDGEWKQAKDCCHDSATRAFEALGGYAYRASRGRALYWAQLRKSVDLALSLRLRRREDCDASRLSRGRHNFMRLPVPDSSPRKWAAKQEAWHVKASRLCRLERYVVAVQHSLAQGMEELRRARDNSLRTLEDIRGFLVRHGADVPVGAVNRTEGQQRELCPGELQVGYSPRAGAESSEQCLVGHSERPNDNGPSGTDFRPGPGTAMVADQARLDPRSPVYDLLNAGPLRRFTIRGADGHCFIVSNCENVVMGIECDIQRHGQANCERNGFPVVLEVYDELVAEVPESQADLEAFYQCMLDQPSWVKELSIPVAVEGWVGDRYKK